MQYSRKKGEEEALLNLDKPRGANGGDSSQVPAFLRAKAESGGIDVDLHFHGHIREKQAAFIAGWLVEYREQPTKENH